MILSATKAMIDNSFNEFYTETLQNEYNKKRFIEPLITRDLESISDSLKTFWMGLEYAVKTASSIEDKIKRVQKQDPELSPDEVLASLRDVIRYTQICEHDKIFDVAKDTIKSLEDKGYVISGINNYYENPYKTTGYKGLHINVISPLNQEFELQIHSEESFEAKQTGHEIYERIRAVSTPIEEKKRLQPEILRIHSQVPNPPGYDTLHSFHISHNDGNDELQNGNLVINVVNKIDSNLGVNSFYYTVVDNDSEKVLLSGFENHQSDGSVIAGRKFDDNNKAQISTLTKSGELTTTSFVDELSYMAMDPEKTLNLSVVLEKTNELWNVQQAGVVLTQNDRDFVNAASDINKTVDSLLAMEPPAIRNEVIQKAYKRVVAEIAERKGISTDDINKAIRTGKIVEMKPKSKDSHDESER